MGLQKINRELKNENRHLQQNKIVGIEKERSEKQLLSKKSVQEKNELKNQIDILRQQLHDERTSWGLEKNKLLQQIDENQTSLSTYELKFQSLQEEVNNE